MAGFALCSTCQAEYENPLDRRFHAQPIACPTCGPQLEFHWGTTNQPQITQMDSEVITPSPRHLVTLSPCHPLTPSDPIASAQQVLAAGGIVAVKGIGGFHLACDARNDQAVQILRQRKGRLDKPFALMAWDVEAVRRFAVVSTEEETLLTSRARPIVLLRKRSDYYLSKCIAPGTETIGVMLPYTPLHYLISCVPMGREAQRHNVLVMTSGNDAGEPIVKDNDEALEKLAELADAFLWHNRPIHVACDDSVVRVFAGKEVAIRRSRGYAPFPVKLPFAMQPILAVGGELKSTFCLVTGDHALLSQHIGDMENWETLQAFEQSVKHFQAIFRVQPTVIASDLHPGYLSTKWAQQTAQAGNLRHIQVQHHHAHIAALMAEHGLDGKRPVIGVSFDGTGYGPDGTIWGGEWLIADYRTFQRRAYLKTIPLPGGDAAIKRPYRLALAHLWAAGVDWHERLPPVAACPQTERNILLHQFTTGFHCVPTSSMGRLFDAVAALAGVRQSVTYEGQAAIELEALSEDACPLPYPFALAGDEVIVVDPTLLVRAIANDVLTDVPTATIAARFHSTVAEMIVQLSLRIRDEVGLNQVALSGGVFQNMRLLTMVLPRLQAHQFEVLWHCRVPANDGGLALGQAMIANSNC